MVVYVSTTGGGEVVSNQDEDKELILLEGTYTCWPLRNGLRCAGSAYLACHSLPQSYLWVKLGQDFESLDFFGQSMTMHNDSKWKSASGGRYLLCKDENCRR